MSPPTETTTPARRLLEALPGDLMIWVLIVSELLVFGAGLLGFLGARIADPGGFAAAAAHLERSLDDLGETDRPECREADLAAIEDGKER